MYVEDEFCRNCGAQVPLVDVHQEGDRISALCRCGLVSSFRFRVFAYFWESSTAGQPSIVDEILMQRRIRLQNV